ncbi:MAG: hypothetical protein HC822_16795 [Oscillochloris sp.]|nr:hypothetical protein [Oscillochloris sp.]
MSRAQRALIALAPIITLMLLGGLLGAGNPRPTQVAAAVPVVNESTTVVGQTSAASPIPTATVIPPTATLARRDFQDTAAIAIKVAPTAFLPGRGPGLPGEFVVASKRLDFYLGSRTFSADEVAAMAISAEHALGYMQRRFDTELRQRVSVGVYQASQAPSRGTRGIAYTYGDTNVRIYYGSHEDRHKALVILTHELAHALQAEAYGKEAQSRADIVLLEGLASFISGEYWLSLSDSPSFIARARELYNAGYRGNLATMNRNSADVAYDMWAGFVEYLTRTYGWDAFNMLYVSGRGRAAGSADYVGVYGKSFKELAAEYYAVLAAE